ncbi:MAG: AAA family ATPase [Frankia sp.]|nr:AAA family ATPase [Frankia sp.]
MPVRNGVTASGLAELVADQINPLETVETHTATLFFTADRVYKLKKPVNLGFLDFSTPEARLAACKAEVRLNHRLSPDVYLGVTEVRDDMGLVRDHMVVMRRLPAQRRLSTLVRRRLPINAELRALARLLAAFHERCETSPEISKAGSQEVLEGLWHEGIAGVAPFRGSVLDPDTVDETGRLALRYLAGRGPLLTSRQEAGRIRDGHGDLLADDIYCLPDGPRVLDCIEFDQRLRVGDVLGDVAFLAMDLERLGAADDAERFLAWYREFSGENHPPSLEHLYIAYRAFVRTKIACIRHSQGDPDAAGNASRLARIALNHLRRGRSRLVLVGGLPGTGKSTLARHLAGEGDGWVLLRSDIVRKELAAIPPDAHVDAGIDSGIYSADATEATYAELLRRAEHALVHGENVIIDASWTSGRMRAQARRLAEQTSADLLELRCVASPALAAARIARRQDAGDDPSDATPAVHRAMAARADPWPTAIDIHTAVPIAETVAAARRHIA